MNLVEHSPKHIPFNLSPFTQPKNLKPSCDDCYFYTDCTKCPLDCGKCSATCPPNCATCTPSCSSCAQDCPLDCDKCKAHCPPNCDRCKVHCPPNCDKLLNECELPFGRCQSFIFRTKFSGGYAISRWKMSNAHFRNDKGWEVLIRFLPNSTTGGLFSLNKMGVYLESSKIKIYLGNDILTHTQPVEIKASNKVKFKQDFRKSTFTLSLNNQPLKFPRTVPSQVFDSTIVFGICLGESAPMAGKTPFIGCMGGVSVNRVLINLDYLRPVGSVSKGCELQSL